MKIKIVFLMTMISCVSFSTTDAAAVSFDYEPVAVCLGSVSFPKTVAPDLNFYYKGKKLSIDVYGKEKEFKIVPYSLEEQKSTQQFHMIICSECKFLPKDGTIQHLYVPQGIAYKFYTLSAARRYNENQEVDGYLWSVMEEQLLDGNIIPDNTVIFLFNANFIAGLHVKSWPQDSSARILPEIVIKDSVNQVDLSREVIISRLAAMDMDTIHKHGMTALRQINKQAVLSLKS